MLGEVAWVPAQGRRSCQEGAREAGAGAVGGTGHHDLAHVTLCLSPRGGWRAGLGESPGCPEISPISSLGLSFLYTEDAGPLLHGHLMEGGLKSILEDFRQGPPAN